MLQTHAGLCHFMVRTVLTVAGYWAVSSVSSFLPRKLTWDRTAVAHSQSCTLGYLNLLSSCPRRTSCQEHPAWRAFAARLGTSCILNPSLGMEGSQVPEKSRKLEWDRAAQWPWLWVGSPGLGGGQPPVHQQCLGLIQWLPGVTDGKEHW